MNTNASVEQPHGKSDVTGGVLKGLVKVGILILVAAAALFISSRRLDWVMGWVYVGVCVASTVVGALILPPELQAERAQVKEGFKGWDIPLVIFMARVGPLIVLIVAGLDVGARGTTQIPLALQIAGVVLAVLGFALTTWAMMVNKFFSSVVRIQKDRGHTVVTGGPYQAMRHPGYVGAIAFNLATPLILGSLWAFVPTALVVGVTIVRTALEDRTLQEELDGYKEYAQQVRYRLLPGVW